MPRIHDRGGWPDAGPINKSEHELAPWEKITDAVLVALVDPQKPVMRVDEMRRTLESFSPEAYEKLSYYERWITAIEALMIEKGILTREEIDRKVQEMANDGEI